MDWIPAFAGMTVACLPEGVTRNLNTDPVLYAVDLRSCGGVQASWASAARSRATAALVLAIENGGPPSG